MRAVRYALIVAGLLTASLVPAADAPVRGTPTRPGQPPTATLSLVTTKIGGVDYVKLADVAKKLGLKATATHRGKDLTLSDATVRVDFDAESREALLNGLRLWLGQPIAVKGDDLLVSRVDFDRCVLPRLKPALVPALPPKPKVIAIDPGHGGGDPGMENEKLKLQEKVLTLDVALRLEKLLKADGYSVVLTRRDDRQLAPEKVDDWRMRGDIANRANADLLVSIHFNSLFPDTKTSGTETYVFTPMGQRSTRAWSPTQKDDTEEDRAPVNRYDAWSSVLAQSVHRGVLGNLKTSDRGQKTMHSAVLRGLDCPGVLVESVFLSNEGEGKRAGTPEFRQQIAAAIAAGIKNYVITLDGLRPPAKS